MRAQAEQLGRTSHLDLKPWHALQEALRLGPTNVKVAFAGDLADLIPPVAVRLRRDYPTLLALIQAHALLHQGTRTRAPTGAVIAIVEDYGAVRELLVDLVSQGVGATVPSSIRETVHAVAMPSDTYTDGVSVTDLAKSLRLDKSSVSRRTREAIEKAYLKNLEDKRGRPAKLPVGDPLPDDIDVLPSVETLKAKRCAVAPSPEGDPPSPSPIDPVRPSDLAEAE